MNAHLTRNLTKLAIAVAAMLASTATHAATFNFHVDLNVSSLIGAPNSPFFVDFQLNEGSGTIPNMVTINNFLFTSGSASGSATTFGLATGTMGSSITLNDNSSSPFNEIFQGFTAGTTHIQFDVSLSQNSPGVTPDGFIISILDSEANNPQITTTDFSGSSMITVPIGGANTLGDVQTFTSTSPAGATATVTPATIPEPSSVMALIGGVGCLMTLRRRRSQAAA
ncbi:MAG TPA: NF038129 family PEP-CTERM protein [Chthoniobacter sp.]|nr:NF038129 family PEP-CTERM protein [Chthoniobacter sp.]